MLLLALIGGLIAGAATGSKKAGVITGGGIALIALLVLYAQGEEDRAKVEEKLKQLPIEDRIYWEPVLDEPELIPVKARELFKIAS